MVDSLFSRGRRTRECDFKFGSEKRTESIKLETHNGKPEFKLNGKWHDTESAVYYLWKIMINPADESPAVKRSIGFQA
jgi:hypothetical protein